MLEILTAQRHEAPMSQPVLPVPQSVAIVGMGGLGCPASLALAWAGVKRLTLIDPDVVELSNLHRQPWHHQADVGRPKVLSAKEKLLLSFPSLEVEIQQRALDADGAPAVFAAHDLIIDGTDSVKTKFLLSDAAVKARKPLIYAGVLRFEGLCMRIEPGGPCLRCLFETPPTEVLSCAQAGVLGAMAGLIGGLQVELALAPPADITFAQLHVIDGLAFTSRVVKVRKRVDCEACAA